MKGIKNKTSIKNDYLSNFDRNRKENNEWKADRLECIKFKKFHSLNKAKMRLKRFTSKTFISTLNVSILMCIDTYISQNSNLYLKLLHIKKVNRQPGK